MVGFTLATPAHAGIVGQWDSYTDGIVYQNSGLTG